jgi:four helix bundle protein
MKTETFHEKLKEKMDTYVHLVYMVTKNFPKDELYGATSQLRRAALSVILNYIEGYARIRDKVHKNFLEISYGSLKESRYLLDFVFVEKYMEEKDHNKTTVLADEIGAMLWGILRKL